MMPCSGCWFEWSCCICDIVVPGLAAVAAVRPKNLSRRAAMGSTDADFSAAPAAGPALAADIGCCACISLDGSVVNLSSTSRRLRPMISASLARIGSMGLSGAEAPPGAAGAVEVFVAAAAAAAAAAWPGRCCCCCGNRDGCGASR